MNQGQLARSDETNPRIALIGAGIMGAGMAERLLDQGFAVDVWDRTPAAAARLAERGATAHGHAGATREPGFSALGRRVLWLGAAGMGMRLKLVLNTWLAFEIEAAAEASAAADRLGVPYGALLAAVQGGPLASATALARLAKMEN